jgi:hypothetical protein
MPAAARALRLGLRAQILLRNGIPNANVYDEDLERRKGNLELTPR